jgi:hypothetical protein
MPAMPVTRRWPALRRVLVAALWLAPLFLVPIVYLALHRAGEVARQPYLAYERTLIFDLVLYWLLAAGLLAALLRPAASLAWIKERKGPLLLLLFSTLLSLAFLELALRILRPSLGEDLYERWPSPIVHHRNAPNRSSQGMGGHTVSTNEDGFRTRYSRAEFLAKQHRVLLLGDSYVFGLGVAEEDSLARRLEAELTKLLAERGGGGEVAVLNTGVISYSPLLERAAFRHFASAYRPTATLLFLDVNDIGDDYQYGRENVSRDPGEPRWAVPDRPRKRGLCEASALCKASRPLHSKLLLPFATLAKRRGGAAEDYDYYRFEVKVGGKVEKDRFFVLRHPLAETRPYFEATLAHVEALARDVEAAGSSFGLVVVPRYFHWNDAECPRNWEGFRYKVDEPFENEYLRFFDEAAARESFPVWGLVEEFRAFSGGPLVFEQDPHWNEAGHLLAARAVAARLAAAGWPAEKREER